MQIVHSRRTCDYRIQEASRRTGRRSAPSASSSDLINSGSAAAADRTRTIARAALSRSPCPPKRPKSRTFHIGRVWHKTASGHPLRDATLKEWGRLWDRFFGEPRPSPRRTIAVQQCTISVTSGLAAMKKLEGLAPARRQMELGFLKDTLARELRQRPETRMS